MCQNLALYSICQNLALYSICQNLALYSLCLNLTLYSSINDTKFDKNEVCQKNLLDLDFILSNYATAPIALYLFHYEEVLRRQQFFLEYFVQSLLFG